MKIIHQSVLKYNYHPDHIENKHLIVIINTWFLSCNTCVFREPSIRREERRIIL